VDNCGRKKVPGLNTRNRIITELRSMFRVSIEEHRESRDPNHPRDYIDCYLDQMERDNEFDLLNNSYVVCLVPHPIS